MTLRFVLIAFFALACGPLLAGSPMVRPTFPMPTAPPMAFYVAKGAPDSCGRGCDSWIAVEGQIDSGAAARFWKFLQRNRARNLPLYFYSPGGNLEQALTMGTMLRQSPMVARVGRTVVTECGFEAQDSDVCVKLKQSGRELHGDLVTRNAMCNSACPYLILGASVREIAPDAVLAVHTPKVMLTYHGEAPPESMRAVARARGLERANNLVARYLSKMDVAPGLLDVAKTVPFEGLHLLTRDELDRFRIDSRRLAETAWTFEQAARPFVRKFALVRKPDGASFRTMEWRLFCDNMGAQVMFIREMDKAATGPDSVTLMAGSEKPVAFGSYPARLGKYEAWNGRITTTALNTVLLAPQLQITLGTTLLDGRVEQDRFDMDTAGLHATWTRLSENCPKAADRPSPVVSGPAQPVSRFPAPLPPP